MITAKELLLGSLVTGNKAVLINKKGFIIGQQSPQRKLKALQINKFSINLSYSQCVISQIVLNTTETRAGHSVTIMCTTKSTPLITQHSGKGLSQNTCAVIDQPTYRRFLT